MAKLAPVESPFRLVSEFSPTGDQPEAIRQLVEGSGRGDRFPTLLAITGSGKTFTVANVIAQLGKPALLIAHNKTLAAQLYGELKQLFPRNPDRPSAKCDAARPPGGYVPASD